MNGAFRQLLDLRRLRERNAAEAMRRAVLRSDDEAARLQEMERRQTALAVATEQRIAGLYDGSLSRAMGPGALDRLVDAVDEQYLLRTRMHLLVDAQQRRRDEATADVDRARGLLNERRRKVQALEFLAEDFGRAAAVSADLREEADAERPHVVAASIGTGGADA